MNLLTLDLGTKCGWALGNTNNDFVDYSGCEDFSVNKKFTPLSFANFAKFVYSIQINSFNSEPMLVLHERPGMMPHWNTIRIHHGMNGILEMLGATFKFFNIDVSPTTVKKFWTGSGRADKPYMVQCTQNLYPKVTNDNESDAIAIWHWYQIEGFKCK